MNRRNARTIEHARPFLGTIQASVAQLVSNLRGPRQLSQHDLSPTLISRTSLAAVSLLAISTLTTIASPATAEYPSTGNQRSPPVATPRDIRTPGDPVAGPSDVDGRGTALPTALQRQALGSLGEVTARWNSLGTPASILPASGSLGAASGAPDVAARGWLRDHAALFGMSASAVDGLELVSSQKLAQSPARAVLFRQDFGGVAPALGGLVTVGVANGKVAYVSSSLARTTSAMPAAVLTPLQGWLKAAATFPSAFPRPRSRRSPRR